MCTWICAYTMGLYALDMHVHVYGVCVREREWERERDGKHSECT